MNITKKTLEEITATWSVEKYQDFHALSSVEQEAELASIAATQAKINEYKRIIKKLRTFEEYYDQYGS
jgi:hypothetical protein